MFIELPSGRTERLVWSGKTCRINRRYGARVIKGKARLFNTTEYTHFIEDMTMQFRSQKVKPFTGNVSVIIAFSLSRKKGRKTSDVDAYNKQILDALEHSGVLLNDSQVRFQATLNAGNVEGNGIDVISVIVSDMPGDIRLFAGPEPPVAKPPSPDIFG